MQQIVNAISPRIVFAPLKMAYETIRVYEAEFDHHAPPFDMIYFQLESGDSTPKDRHIETEIWIILSGSGKLTYDNNETRLQAGDSVHFAPNHYHQVFNDGCERLLICSLSWV